MKKIDYKKELKHLYKPSPKSIELVDVPEMNFLMIDGQGAYSARFRPAIPEEAGHPFRLIPATYSGASRPPIPDDSGHPHQCHTAEGGAG